MALPPEKLLLRWVNYHLQQSGCGLELKNYGKGLANSEVYAALLGQVVATHATHATHATLTNPPTPPTPPSQTHPCHATHATLTNPKPTHPPTQHQVAPPEAKLHDLLSYVRSEPDVTRRAEKILQVAEDLATTR